MREFTRFEYQYIMMLAFRAKHDMQKAKDENDPLFDIDPNADFYIESLHAIGEKAKANEIKLDEIEREKKA